MTPEHFNWLEEELKRREFPNWKDTWLKLRDGTLGDFVAQSAHSSNNVLADPAVLKELKRLEFDPRTHQFVEFSGSERLSILSYLTDLNPPFAETLPDTLKFGFFVCPPKTGIGPMSTPIPPHHTITEVHTILTVGAGGSDHQLNFGRIYRAQEGPLPTKAEMLSDIRQLTQNYIRQMEKAARIIASKTFDLVAKTQGVKMR